jgi:hypothetical protein
MSKISKITIALIAALILIATPACESKKDEAVEAARAEKWLKARGADPEKLDRLSNRQIIELKEAVERGERSVTTGGKEIHIEPIVPTGPMGSIGPRRPDINFEYDQLVKKFDKHAADFGVTGTGNRANITRFQAAMEQHIADPATQVINGTYRQTIPVTHYVNPNTGLNVMKDAAGNYLSGWRLNPGQLNNVLTRGSL